MTDPTPAPSAAPDEWAGLRAAAKAATPGPWHVEDFARNGQAPLVVGNHMAVAETFDKPHLSDAEFIAAANPATILRLLDELAAVRAGAGEADAAVERAVEAAYDNGLNDHRAHDCCTGRDAAKDARLRGAVEAVLDHSCHHCGRLPDDDGDHTCPCPKSDSECLEHTADPVVSRTALLAALGDPA